MKTKLVIFGVTGDLGKRKLLPALENIFATGKFDDLSVVGVSRREVNPQDLLDSALGGHKLADKFSMFTMDLAEESDYVRLKQHVDEPDTQVLFYLSVPPSATTQIVTLLGQASLNGKNIKLLLEKPFGFDIESAKVMTQHISQYFDDDQVYRIDHYLAKEMAQNLVVIRGANALFHHVWNNNFIQSIDIVAAESIDIEGRAQFYEQTGALRDVLQGHLMQLLALVLMDIPEKFDWSVLPELRLKALEQVQPANPETTIRAQYDGYETEVGNPDSQTETFVSMELFSTQVRWLDVPIRLTTGKALAEKSTEICINLKPLQEARNNKIILRIQPNEGMDVGLFVKTPGYERELEKQHLEFSFDKTKRMPDAYEQVFVDAVMGKKSLFASSDEILRAWEIIEPVQQAWGMHHHSLRRYKKGASVDSILES